MKRTRRVFGRIKIELSGQRYRLELRTDGLWIRQHRSRREWLVPLAHCLRLCSLQTELFTPNEFMEKSKQVE